MIICETERCFVSCILLFITPESSNTCTGAWSVSSDVYSFGVVLQSLITRIVVDSSRPITFKYWFPPEDVIAKMRMEHIEPKVEITKLVCYCLNIHPPGRPRLKQVFERLLALQLVQRFVFHNSLSM